MDRVSELIDMARLMRKPVPVVRPIDWTTPHTCPVCIGAGQVPHGFYYTAASSTCAAPVTCRACDGRGLVWSAAAPTLQDNCK